MLYQLTVGEPTFSSQYMFTDPPTFEDIENILNESISEYKGIEGATLSETLSKLLKGVQANKDELVKQLAKVSELSFLNIPFADFYVAVERVEPINNKK